VIGRGGPETCRIVPAGSLAVCDAES